MFNPSIILSILTCFFLAGCGGSNNQPSEIISPRGVSSYHIVKRGETVKSIAKKYKIPVKELILMNGLKPPYRVVQHQRIKVKSLKLQSNDYYASGDDLEVKSVQDDPFLKSTVKVKSDMEEKFFGNASSQTKDFLKKGIEESKQISDQSGKADFNQLEVSQQIMNEKDEETKKFLPFPKKGASAVTDSKNYVWPVHGNLLRTYDPKTGSNILIEAPAGTKVKSITDGKVTSAGKDAELRSWGQFVVLKHKDGKMSFYGFLKEVYVKTGQTIKKGDVIGTVGINRKVNKAMLALQLRQSGNKKPIDPVPFLS